MKFLNKPNLTTPLPVCCVCGGRGSNGCYKMLDHKWYCDVHHNKKKKQKA